jgi:TolA-binding protein
MTAPKRLIEEGTSFDRTLLRAAREDRPSSDFERRVIAAAVLGPVALATALPRPSLLARLARPRFVAIAAIAVGAAALAILSGDRGAPVTAASTLAAPPMPVQVDTTEPASLPPKPEPAGPNVAIAVTTPEALPSVPPPATAMPAAMAAPRASTATAAAPAATTPPASEPAGPAAAGSSLQREVELLDAVKRSLRSGAPSDAERALDAYDKEFPRGSLAPEAGFLRVRLLLAKGDRAGAVALGDELLRRDPNSVHTKRIRAALAADGGEKTQTQEAPR